MGQRDRYESNKSIIAIFNTRCERKLHSGHESRKQSWRVQIQREVLKKVTFEKIPEGRVGVHQATGKSLPHWDRGLWKVLENLRKWKKMSVRLHLEGHAGLEVRLESREAAGHCRGHVRGLRGGPSSRESSERHLSRWELWSLSIFKPSPHPAFSRPDIVWSLSMWLSPLQMSELNIGDIKLLAQGYPLTTCESWDSNPGLPFSRAHTLNHHTLLCLMPSKNSPTVCSPTSF